MVLFLDFGFLLGKSNLSCVSDTKEHEHWARQSHRGRGGGNSARSPFFVPLVEQSGTSGTARGLAAKAALI